MKTENLFEPVPDPLEKEWIETLAEGEGPFRIERIVSRGHASPAGFWYDQDSIEWVVLLQGSATLEFANDSEEIFLKPGDWVTIPPHEKHRVKETAKNEDTIWLAVHGSGAEPV